MRIFVRNAVESTKRTYYVEILLNEPGVRQIERIRNINAGVFRQLSAQ